MVSQLLNMAPFCPTSCSAGLKKSTVVKRVKSVFTLHLGAISSLSQSKPEEGVWWVTLLMRHQPKAPFEDAGKRISKLLKKS